MDTEKGGRVIVLRTRRCRKSDVVLRFLNEHHIPHTVKYLETDKEAQQLAEKYNIMSSPGIIISGKTFNAYELVEHCQVKDPENTREKFINLLKEAE